MELIDVLFCYVGPSTEQSSSRTDGQDGSSLRRSTSVRVPLSISRLNATDHNPLLQTDVLDGAMITLALFTLNIFHPGFLLPRHHPLAGTQHGSTTGAGNETEMSVRDKRASEETAQG